MTDRYSRTRLLLLPLLLAGCDAAGNVAVQELPALERSSLEARLGLPEVRGTWRFAGWELQEGDTMGIDAELATYGIVWLGTQKRDSLAGYYVTAAGRAPLYGEVRRDGVLSLVTFLAPSDGRYLAGALSGDTLWLETTSLSEPGSWRDGSRAAFIRSQQAVTPFRRVRGAAPPPPPVDSAALAAADSARAAAAAAAAMAPGATAAPGGATPAAQPPATLPSAARPPAAAPPVSAPPVTAPVEAEPVPEEAEEAEEPVEEPDPEPVRPRPTQPRVLGVPVERDDN